MSASWYVLLGHVEFDVGPLPLLAWPCPFPFPLALVMIHQVPHLRQRLPLWTLSCQIQFLQLLLLQTWYALRQEVVLVPDALRVSSLDKIEAVVGGSEHRSRSG